jgi:hypothetical protein
VFGTRITDESREWLQFQSTESEAQNLGKEASTIGPNEDHNLVAVRVLHQNPANGFNSILFERKGL